MSPNPESNRSRRGNISGGLYDGFEGYATPPQDEYVEVLTNGIIVPDTNVLLNLYRYTEDARTDFLHVLNRLSERLWIPHQVLAEFWRNRESVMRDPGETKKTIEELRANREKAESNLRAWANRVFLPEERVDELIAQLDKGSEGIIERIRELGAERTVEFARDTSKDPTLLELEQILDGRVGPPLNSEAHDRAVSEGMRRSREQIPPGYKDKKKGDVASCGDFLVWEQILVETKERLCDAVIVTGDVKEDWWREEGGERRGPRIELVNEMRERTGRRLYMLRPSQLLEYANQILSMEVSEESLRDVDLVDDFVSESEQMERRGGWNVFAARELLRRLDAQDYHVQAEVIRYAAQKSGFAERFAVYDLGDYPDDRSLRGFVKPINRICQQLRSEGEVATDAVDVLHAVYNDDSPDVGWTAGYRLHGSVVDLFQFE